MADFSLIVVAGGSGTRMGAATPKAFMELAGEALLLRAVRAFAGVAGIAETIVVVPRDEMPRLTGHDSTDVAALEITGQGSRAALARQLLKAGVTRFVAGGKRRQDSVLNGLRAANERCEYVLVHDAARPFVRPEKIEGLMARTREVGAAILALPVKDTLKRVDQNGNISTTVDRAMLWAAQTPQAFRRVRLIKAHEQFGKQDVTDDAALLERSNDPCAVVEGDPGNFKITTPEDFVLAQRLLADAKTTEAKRPARQHSAVFYQVPEQQTVIDLDPPEILDASKARTPEQMLALARTAYDARDYRRALKLATSAVNEHADFADTHSLVAACFDQLGRAADAVGAAQNAAEADPDNPSRQADLGRYLLAAKRFAEAEKALAAALALDGKLAATHLNRAVALAELGQSEQARKHLKTALDLQPGLSSQAENIPVLRKLA